MTKFEEAILDVTKSAGEPEATAYPVWFILDPKQMMKPDCYYLASMIAGPFFSRKSAEETLKATRYNYGKNAIVYCASGTYSADWIKLYKSSLELRKEMNK